MVEPVVDEFDFGSAVPVTPEDSFDFGSAVQLPIEGEKLYLENQQATVELPSGGVKRLQAIISGAYDKGTAGRAINELYSRQMFGDDSPQVQESINQLKEKSKADFGLDSWSFEDIARASAEQTPQLLGLAETSLRRGLQGSMMGGGVALAGGQLGPQIATPEEIVTVPAAALTGGIIGAKYGVAEYSFMQNAGEAYGEFSEFLDKEGVKIENKNLARVGAVMVGAMNAGFDTISLGQMSKVFVGENLIFNSLKSSGAKSVVVPKTKEAIFRWVLDLGKAVAVESATEGLQEGTKGLGGNVVKNLSTQEFKNLTAEQIFSNMGEAASEAAKVSLVMGGGGGVVRAGTSMIAGDKADGMVSDPGLAAKTLAESEITKPEVKAAIDTLTSINPDFTMGQLQQAVENPQSMQDPVIAAKVMMQTATPDIKAQIQALPKDFTMDDLQAISQQANLPYEQSPEFKAKFEGSKVVDAKGKPVLGLHGTGKEFTNFQDGNIIFLSNSPDTANSYAKDNVYGDQPNVRIGYMVMKNPLIVDAQGFDWHSIEFNGEIIDTDAIAKHAKENGYDGLIVNNVTDDLNAEGAGGRNGNTTYAVFSPDQIIPAFGDGIKKTSLRSLDVPKKEADVQKKELYNRILAAEKPDRFAKTKDMMDSFQSAIGKALSPISTRLRNINPKLEARLRKFEFDRNKAINADSAIAKPFLEKFSKLSNEDKAVLDFAMKNGDAETINEIAEANGMTAEIEALREMFNALYKRAKKVNLDIGYRKNYFPRFVENPKKLLAYFGKTEAWNDIQGAIRNKEEELGQPLTTEEKAHLINTLLRGYQVAGITLAKPGALKERNIDQVTPEINEFYATTDQAIIRYISSVNDAIETRNFLGKDAETIEDSIGAFVLRELEKGTLNPNQAQELSEILKARFHQGKMNPLLKAYKNLSYIDTMGSPISAITQLSGLGYSLSNNGFYNTLRVLPSAVAGKGEVTLEDVGIDRIAEEFSDGGTTGNAVRKVFKAVGLQKLDSMDKLVFLNSTLNRYRAAAKKPTKEFKAGLENIFDEETDSVIADLQNGVNSRNVQLLLWSEILNMQPLAKSEMPELYLSHPNGRIFYMLKSFTLKQYDIYRRQVFQEIRDGNTVKGLKNLTRLVSFFVMMSAGADFLKDLLLNRETEPDDIVITNIARVFGFSKYQVYSVKREGFGTAAFKTIAPPFKAIDSMSKDMAKAVNEGEVNLDELESVNSVPIAGKFYYWWFGAGADK